MIYVEIAESCFVEDFWVVSFVRMSSVLSFLGICRPIYSISLELFGFNIDFCNLSSFGCKDGFFLFLFYFRMRSMMAIHSFSFVIMVSNCACGMSNLRKICKLPDQKLNHF